MNNSQDEFGNKLFSWANKNNLQLIVQFHNEQRRLMRNQIVTINKKLDACNDKDERRELLYAKTVYTNTFDKMLCTNTFLMMYSHLEEFLYHVRKSFGRKQVGNDPGSVKRFKELIKNVIGLDLNKDREWEFICDCGKVRNCLLHANGRVSISTDKNDLERIINKSCDGLSVKLDRIELSGKLLDKFSNTIESLIKRIETTTSP